MPMLVANATVAQPTVSREATAAARAVRLALVHDWLTGMRGGEKCLAALCRAYPDAPLYTLFRRPGAVDRVIESRRIESSWLDRLPGIDGYYRWLLPLMPAAARSLRPKGPLDVMLSFSHAVAKSVLPPPGVPHVCYCFTPMRYAWQLRGEYRALFEHVGQGRRLRRIGQAGCDRLLDRLCRWDRATSGSVTHFVAASRTVAERIRVCYDRSSRVIYPPVDTDFYTPAAIPRGDYYLCVSALVPYKRLELAIEACNRLRRPLVVVGSGPEARRLARRAGPGVRFEGHQSDAAIRAHYRRCRALLFPGIEDFGIVPVEAQACGAPVIALARGGAVETVQAADGQRPGTGVFFHEPAAEALAEAIERFERGEEQCDALLARRNAEQFRTSRFLREMLGLVHAVCYNRRLPDG